MADPIVVHPLGVFGVADQPRDVQATVNLKFVANHADNGYRFACPLVFFDELKPVCLAPLDLLLIHNARLDGFHAHHPHLTVFRRVLHCRHVAVVQMHRRRRVLSVEILCNAHRLLADPRAQALVAHAALHHGRYRRCVGELALVFVSRQVFSDEAPLRIRPTGVLDRRVHVDAERVAHPSDSDVLLEAVVVAVLGQEPDVALAVGHLVLAGGVVGYVSVRDVLDVPHDAVEYLSDLYVGLVVHRDDLAAGPVLPLVVGDLLDVLGQLVNRQAWPGVDRLPLDAASRRQHICRPLPLVVGTACGEAQVV